MSLIEEGLAENLISLSDDQKRITYIYQSEKNNLKSKDFTKPEQKVQAETFLKLVLEYGYPETHIEQFRSVKMGSDSREADIIVYNDAEWTEPKIVVECKHQQVSQQEFDQAVRQGFSYANALAGTVKYIWVTSGLLDKHYRYDKEKDVQDELTDLPAYGSDSVAPYQFVKGGGSREFVDGKGKTKKQVLKDIKKVTEEELTRLFKQAHDALWAGGQLNPSEAFDELDKLIFCKIWDEKYNLSEGKLIHRKKGEIYDFQIILESNEEKTNKELAKRVHRIYKAGKNFDKEVFKDDIRLSDKRIRTIVEYLQKINLNETDLDSKGRAFETFMGSFFRGEFGQYFTPRPIVQFIVEALPIKNTSLVLDTSCGSGGFLLHALDKVRKQANVEFPNYEDDVQENRAWFEYWHNFAENHLYGIEINEQIARTAKMNMIIHDDGHTNVISEDGLLSEREYTKQNKGFQFNRFDFIITNPPFGSSIKKNEKSYLTNFILGINKPDWLDYRNNKEKTRNSQNTEVLFIEQCYNFLNEGGYLAVVLPDGILTNSSLQYVRDQIEDWYRIVSIVSMPQTAFSATGAGVKSSVLFLKKNPFTLSRKLEKLKSMIQISLLTEYDYLETIENWQKEKAERAKKMDGFNNTTDFTTVKEIKAHTDFKEWKDELYTEYNNKIDDLKETLSDRYKEEKSKQLPDYPILMAIADNIGYDATGKVCATVVNKEEVVQGNHTKIITHLSHDLYDERISKTYDLQDEEIAARKDVVPAGILKELSHFINQIENGRI